MRGVVRERHVDRRPARVDVEGRPRPTVGGVPAHEEFGVVARAGARQSPQRLRHLAAEELLEPCWREVELVVGRAVDAVALLLALGVDRRAQPRARGGRQQAGHPTTADALSRPRRGGTGLVEVQVREQLLRPHVRRRRARAAADATRAACAAPGGEIRRRPRRQLRRRARRSAPQRCRQPRADERRHGVVRCSCRRSPPRRRRGVEHASGMAVRRAWSRGATVGTTADFILQPRHVRRTSAPRAGPRATPLQRLPRAWARDRSHSAAPGRGRLSSGPRTHVPRRERTGPALGRAARNFPPFRTP